MDVVEREFLPTNTRSVHASSVVIWQGHPVFSWFGGLHEGSGTVAIYIYNLKGTGDMIVLGNKDDIPRWNPILMTAKDKIFLFERAGRFCDCWQTFFHDITHWDEHTTQKEMVGSAQYIPSGLNGPVKTAPYIINDRIVCGSSVETAFDWTSYMEYYWLNTSYIHFDQRSNPLRSKERKAYIDYAGRTRISLGIIQPTIWEDNNGSLHALMRSSHGLKTLYYAFSPDGECDNWTPAVKTNIPNPNSAVDTVYYNGQLYLAYNPDEMLRFPLTLAKVALDYVDDGEAQFVVEDAIDICEQVKEDDIMSHELSYPYMIEDEGYIRLTYTYGRTRIEHCVISP